MRKHYTVHFSWERFDVRKALAVVLLVLVTCFSAVFVTARPAEAEKNRTETHKYYTGITVRQGDTLYQIADEQLRKDETSAFYKNRRAYMQEVIDLNRLNNADYLLAGQKLIVPYYSDTERI